MYCRPLRVTGALAACVKPKSLGVSRRRTGNLTSRFNAASFEKKLQSIVYAGVIEIPLNMQPLLRAGIIIFAGLFILPDKATVRVLVRYLRNKLAGSGGIGVTVAPDRPLREDFAQSTDIRA